MRWTIDWLPNAENKLADAWMSSSDPDAVMRASHAIDKLLEVDPDRKAIPIDNFYFLRFDPLAVLVDLDFETHTVRVIDLKVAET